MKPEEPVFLESCTACVAKNVTLSSGDRRHFCSDLRLLGRFRGIAPDAEDTMQLTLGGLAMTVWCRLASI
jgi:hypothetical protein